MFVRLRAVRDVWQGVSMVGCLTLHRCTNTGLCKSDRSPVIYFFVRLPVHPSPPLPSPLPPNPHPAPYEMWVPIDRSTANRRLSRIKETDFEVIMSIARLALSLLTQVDTWKPNPRSCPFSVSPWHLSARSGTAPFLVLRVIARGK